MIVRLTAVVLRLSALYFLWQTISYFGAYQFALIAEEGPFYGFVVMFIMFLLISAALWFFAKHLAPLFYPYEEQDDGPVSLDFDRLERVVVQIIGLILTLLGLHGILMALLGIFVAMIHHDYVPSGAAIFLNLTRGALFSLLGLVLMMRFRGVLHWLGRLRKAGSN